jgi:hypothetical protein
MSVTAIEAIRPTTETLNTGASRCLPPVLWRDPHSVPPEKLAELIGQLECACAQEPANAALRTCLGMAHAMNYDPYRSMDALEQARSIDPNHFWAQAKYAELQYRLRALEIAERETLRALDLATTGMELAYMRRQLTEIRRLKREGTIKPTWTKPLTLPVAGLAALLALVTFMFMVTK